MSLFRRRERRSVDGLADILASARDGYVRGGVTVSDETAMRQSAVWSCVCLIADLVSTLPVDAYRRRGTVPTVVAPPPVLLVEPSGYVDAFAWRRQVLVSWLLRGNAYGIVQQVSDGWPSKIELIAPDLVTVTERIAKAPEFRLVGEPVGKFPDGPLWHAAGLTMPGRHVGVSVLEYARRTIGLGVAAHDYGAQWFDEGAHPSAILQTDQRIDETQARVIKERFLQAVRGKREPAVLGSGMSYMPIQVAANESQFLETIQANVEDIARFFFPSLIMQIGAQVTYQNVEQRSLNLLTFDLDPWIVRLERALTAVLPGGQRSGQYVKANRASLLRTDVMTRYRAHDLAIRAGWKSVNEVRDLEELSPIDDGDQYLWPPYTTAPQE